MNKKDYEMICEAYNLNEDRLPSDGRDPEFGLPEEEKFPLWDEAHVRSAIKFFNYAPADKMESLAKKIHDKMKQYNIPTDIIGDDNKLKQYINITEDNANMDMNEIEAQLQEELDNYQDFEDPINEDWDPNKEVEKNDTGSSRAWGTFIGWFFGGIVGGILGYFVGKKVGANMHKDEITDLTKRVREDSECQSLLTKIKTALNEKNKAEAKSLRKQFALRLRELKMVQSTSQKLVFESAVKQNGKMVSLDNSKQQLSEANTYDPPYNAEQVKHHYGDETYKKLSKDSAHKWRMDTGIELIHKEPTLTELNRVWANWQLMDDKQKSMSDEKSLELFGCTNAEHYEKLAHEYAENDTKQQISEATEDNNQLTFVLNNLRKDLQGELDAIANYDTRADFAEQAGYEEIAKTLRDIRDEEKVHCGELTALLETYDEAFSKSLEDGKKEAGEGIAEEFDMDLLDDILTECEVNALIESYLATKENLSESIASYNERMRKKYDTQKYISNKEVSGGRKAAMLTGAVAGTLAGAATAIASALLTGAGIAFTGMGGTAGGLLGAAAGSIGHTWIDNAEFTKAVQEEASKLDPSIKSLMEQIKKELDAGTDTVKIDKAKVKKLFREFKQKLKASGVVERVRARLTQEAKAKAKEEKQQPKKLQAIQEQKPLIPDDHDKEIEEEDDDPRTWHRGSGNGYKEEEEKDLHEAYSEFRKTIFRTNLSETEKKKFKKHLLEYKRLGDKWNNTTLTESELDPVNKTRCSDIFDKNDIMHPNVKKFILKLLADFKKQCPYKFDVGRIILIGSSTGFQYTMTSDIDINFETSLTKEQANEVWSITPHNIMLPGTQRPVNVFCLTDGKQFDPKDAENMYDITHDKWLKKSEKNEATLPYQYIKDLSRFFIDGAELALSRYRQDYHELELYSSIDVEKHEISEKEKAEKISNKLVDLKNDIDALHLIHHIIYAFRGEGFNGQLFRVNIEMANQDNPRYSPNNLVYKMIDRFGYLEKLNDACKEGWEKLKEVEESCKKEADEQATKAE